MILADMSMHEVLDLFDLVCENFARKFSADLTDADIDNVQHEVSIRLFDVVAELTGQTTDSLFQGMKILIELEEERSNDYDHE